MFNIGEKVKLREDTFILPDLKLTKGSAGVIAYQDDDKSYMVDFDYGKSWFIETHDLETN